MSKAWCCAVLTVLGLSAGPLAAQGSGDGPRGIRLDPVSVAPVRFEEGRVVLDGPWVTYEGEETRSGPMPIPAFDCLGLSVGLGPFDPNAQYCPSACDKGLVMNVPYPSPNTVEDMQSIHAPPGGRLSALGTAWYWNPPAPTRLIMVFVFFNTVLENCSDPMQFKPTGPGVAIDFGVLRSSAPYFYYAYVLNMDSLGVRFPGMDHDGDGYPDGSYQMMLATELGSSGPKFPGFPAYPLLNATGDAAGQCRVGHNNSASYDDALPADGVFTPAECHNYSQGSCPTSRGKANAFFVRRCPADINADGFVDGMDIDLFYEALDARACAADFNGDCYRDGMDIDRFFNEYDSGCR